MIFADVYKRQPVFRAALRQLFQQALCPQAVSYTHLQGQRCPADEHIEQGRDHAVAGVFGHRLHSGPGHTLSLIHISYPLPDAVPPTAEQVRRAEELLEVAKYPG